jgi:hypothetical protein
MKACPRCNTAHNKTGIYCSRSCANVRRHSDETKQKISASVKNISRRINKVNLTCIQCGSIYQVWPHAVGKRKYCSHKCHESDPNGNRAPGGYREGSGRSKAGYYKGIYCGSTYELCWVIWALETGVEFERFEGTLDNGTLKYIPDFLLGDGKTIIEIKGYEGEESVNAKTRLAESMGYKVEVLRKDRLQEMFDYVYETYGTREYYRLYDDYRPIYEYKCGYCGDVVSRDKKSKTDVVYCNPSCAMRGNKRK